MNSAGGRPAVVAACVAVSAAAAAVFTCVPPVLLVELAAAEPFGLGHLLYMCNGSIVQHSSKH
jgi:hypothetical protein